MVSEPNIIVYSCNEKGKCENFVIENKLAISVEDGNWLGSGMYFWDNLSNAKFWYNEKKKRNNTKEYDIICATADLSNMLDLTDLDVCGILQSAWECYCKITHKGENAPLGKKLNVLFNHVPEIYQNFNIIKIFGKYRHTPPNNLYVYNNKSSKPEPTLSVKCIYCVRNDKCLHNSFYIQEGEYDS